MATAELIPLPRPDDVRASDFLPVLSVKQAVERKGMMNEFIRDVMHEKEDYGSIPGAGEKKVLLKPGAEKLCSIFGLTPQYTTDSIIEDWTGEHHGGEPMFYYAYRCALSRGGRFMGEAIGSCSSWESKYRYRWVREDQLPVGTDRTGLLSKGGKQTLFAYEFAIEKAETTGPYGKPAEYWEAFRKAIADGAKRINKPFKSGKDGWGYELTTDTTLYRIPNPDVADVVNTVQKMAQKRALVAAVLIVTNASDAFTQDVEDFEDERQTGRVTGSQSVSTGGELFDDEEDKPQATQKPHPADHVLRAFKSGMDNVDAAFNSMTAAAQKPTEQPQYRWQRANPLEGATIPEELTMLFGKIDHSQGVDRNKAITNARDVMEGCFVELNDVAAMKVHEDMRSRFREYYTKGSGRQASNTHVKALLLDLWEALNAAKERKERGNGGI